MAKKLLLLVNIFILLSIQIGFCGALTTSGKQPKAEMFALKNSSAPVAQINALRWANHSDSATGTSSMRLVLDVSGQVEVDSTYSAAPSPRIIVKLKGAKLGRLANNTNFNSDIVDQVSFSSLGNATTQMVIQLPAGITTDDFKVFTLPGNQQTGKPFRIVIDVNKGTPAPNFNFTAGLKNKTIVIDPGHGGSDPGAIGPNNIAEKTVTFAVAQKVKNLLEKAGAKVVMTRSDDCDVYAPNDTAVEELSARTNVAKQNNADVFVSIHANAYNDRSVGGTATYYYPKTSYDALLADDIQTSIMTNENLQDRGTNQANFYVIKRTTMPAVLVEMAFISNPKEENLLNSAPFQQQIALGITEGLDKFFLHASQQGGTGR